GVAIQTDSFEKQAFSVVQKISASSLDAKLPNVPFISWFTNLVGKGAGIVWEMAECGDSQPEQDTPACGEANVALPSCGTVILGISVGTFKKGLVGDPVFMGAALKSGDKLYQVRRLSQLPSALRSPDSIDRILPDLQVDPSRVGIRPYMTYSPAALLGNGNN